LKTGRRSRRRRFFGNPRLYRNPGLHPIWRWNPIFKPSTKGCAVGVTPYRNAFFHQQPRFIMQNASGTPSHGQLSATPMSQFAYSSSSASNGGGQGGGSGTPPLPPRFNLPDSYWSRQHLPATDERFERRSSFTELVAQHMAASRHGQDTLSKMLERNQEDRENDPRSRMQGQELQIDIRPILVSDFSLSPETLAGLVGLKDPDSEGAQPQASTSSTSSTPTTAATAASGCCIPPACTIL
jgi:hypothetical protein